MTGCGVVDVENNRRKRSTRKFATQNDIDDDDSAENIETPRTRGPPTVAICL